MLEPSLPELAIGFQPFCGFGERLGLEAAGPPLPVAAAGNQAGTFQHFEVFGDGGLSHSEWLGQFYHRSFAGEESGENGAAGGIGERGEDARKRIDSGHCITQRLNNS